MAASSSVDSEGDLDDDSVCIREVWNDNLESEFAMIRDVVDDYPYIAMDTEFPGMVVGAVNPVDSYYENLKGNVNVLKLIQLGLTFSDENGNLPTCVTDKFCVWQFNFREFNVIEHRHNKESIALLRQSGIDFKKNYEEGIEARRLGELLIPSGMVLNDDVRWVTFHGSYDFGYLLKLLTGKNLPETRADFLASLRLFFPVIYDVKHLIKFTNSLHGGLNNIAGQLNVRRIGTSHQAGSDSLLTCRTFVKLKKHFFDGSVPERHAGVLHALGGGEIDRTLIKGNKKKNSYKN